MIDYLEVSSEKNRDNRFTKEDVLSVSGEYGIVNQIEFQGRSFAGASVSNYGVVCMEDERRINLLVRDPQTDDNRL